MPDVVVCGNLTLDDVVAADGAATMGVPGGNVLHAALGARLWTPSVGLVTRAGTGRWATWLVSRITATGLPPSAERSRSVGTPGSGTSTRAPSASDRTPTLGWAPRRSA